LRVRVDAGMNDSVLEKQRMDGIYAVANVNGVDHLYYLNMYRMNGRVAYCIDIGVDITTDIYNSTNDLTISNLSEKQIEYIQGISYFGYEYKGHTDYRYYMAAQELIWEYLSGLKVEWTNVLDVNGPRIQIDNYKRHILAFLEYHSRTVTFDFEDGQILEMGQEFSLMDQSGALSSYEVISMGHSYAEIDGYTLKVKVGTDYVGRDSIKVKKIGYYSYDSTLYYYDNSQRLISNGNFNLKEKEIVWNTMGAKLNVQVIDKDTGQTIPSGEATLSGAVYELYRDNGEWVENFTIDEFGKSSVLNLTYGNYYVKQIEPSEGYLLNEEIIEFEISGNSILLQLEQQVISNEIELIKYFGDKDTGNYEVEENISFLIYNNNFELVDKIITNELGYASIRLPYGTYLVQQENSSFGYAKVEDFEVVVKEFISSSVRYNLIDDYIQCRISLITKDKDSQLPILGNGNSYRIWDKTNSNYLLFQENDIFFANENGELIFPMEIPYGEYILEQVSVEKGYIRNEIGIEISIDDHTELEIIDGILWKKLNFYNKKMVGEVDVITNQEVFVGGENNYSYLKEIRKNISLELLADGIIYQNGEIIYQDGEVIYNVVTNGDGSVLIKDLPLGKYCLSESVSKLKNCFEVRTNRDDISVVRETVELTVLLKKNNVILQNLSELGEEISDSIFELYDKKTNLIYTGITDEEGNIRINNLPVGMYCFVQTSVFKGYILNSDKMCFDSSKVDKDIDLKFINLLGNNGWISIPNTFQDEKNVTKLMLLILVIVIGIGVMFYRKKSYKNYSN